MESKGFTLIEIIVVMSVFMFVIGASLLVFISSVGQQRLILLRQEAINETSYVSEYMSKALRMAKRDDDGICIDEGYIYKLSNENEQGFYTKIKFLNYLYATPICQEFFLDTDGILKEKRGDALPVALTSEKLKINYIKFGINGANGCSTTSCPVGALFSVTDSIQPRLTTIINYEIEDEQRTIQTTVSQRNLNAQ